MRISDWSSDVCSSDLRTTAARPGAPAVAVEIVGDDDLLVNGMEGRLVQVFRNLIGNAVSFSPPGGQILLRASRNGDMVQVVVEDEGSGIPEGKLGAIFDRFYSERPKGEKFGTH